MSVRISLEVPESAFSILRIKPEDFAKEILVAAAVKWYVEREMVDVRKLRKRP